MNAVYKAKKKNLDNTLTAVKNAYSKMQEDAQLEAEAEKLIMQNNQAEILSLLHSYTDSYKLAGQSLGDKLAEGFKPAIDSIKSMIDSIYQELSDARDAALELEQNGSASTAAYSSDSYDYSKSNTFNVSVSSPLRQSPAEQTRQAKATVQRMMFQYS